MSSLGLYIHLPFCAGRCPYCDFFAQPHQPALARRLTPALVRHLERLAPRAGGRRLDHVYLGGGTPSLRPAAEVAELLTAARRLIGLAPECEITLEANPNGLGSLKLRRLRAAGVNRLSLGVQSLTDETLACLGRRHRSVDVSRAVAQARAAGFTNLSLDLIYGLPGQTPALARADLKAALALKPDHVSYYELTLAPETAFGQRYAKGRPPLPDEDAILAMEEQALAMLEAAGLKRYEVSNFARPGRACRHNQDTWRGGDYLALGPGAHGHLNGVRWAYLPDVAAYIDAVDVDGEPLAFREKLSGRQRALELVMLGLRTVEGVDLAAVARLWPEAGGPEWTGAREALIRRGWAVLAGGHLRPTALGLRLADAAAAFFV